MSTLQVRTISVNVSPTETEFQVYGASSLVIRCVFYKPQKTIQYNLPHKTDNLKPKNGTGMFI